MLVGYTLHATVLPNYIFLVRKPDLYNIQNDFQPIKHFL